MKQIQSDKTSNFFSFCHFFFFFFFFSLTFSFLCSEVRFFHFLLDFDLVFLCLSFTFCSHTFDCISIVCSSLSLSHKSLFSFITQQTNQTEDWSVSTRTKVSAPAHEAHCVSHHFVAQFVSESAVDRSRLHHAPAGAGGPRKLLRRHV